MKKWQILPLYWYRTGLYGLKGLRNKEFREKRKLYRESTRRELQRRD